MAVSSAQVAVDDDPAVSLVIGSDATDPETYVRNDGAQSVFLGGSGVTSANGYELAAGAVEKFPVGPGDNLFGICSAGQATTVHVLRFRRPT